MAFESSSQVVKMSKRIFRFAKAVVYSLVGAVDPRLVIKLCVEVFGVQASCVPLYWAWWLHSSLLVTIEFTLVILVTYLILPS